MKTYRNLYPQVYDFENLYWAYRKARKGKRGRPEVAGSSESMDRSHLGVLTPRVCGGCRSAW